MTREEYRRRKRRNRRRRMLIAYTLRAAVGVVLLGIIILAGCGCVYVRDLVKNQEEQMTASSGVPQYGAMPVAADSNDDLSDEGEGSEEVGKGVSGSRGERTGYTVVLDAGHGGNDSGTFSGKILEKNITLPVTEIMQDLLEAQGINVVMTRTEDVYVGLEERTEISNAEDPDLFVSIHCNSYEKDSSIKGMECYYQAEGVAGQEFAEQIMELIAQRGHTKSRGARAEEYYVTQHTEAPAILIELGFMSNSSECTKLNSSEYQQVLAQDIVDGIVLCLTGDED